MNKNLKTQLARILRENVESLDKKMLRSGSVPQIVKEGIKTNQNDLVKFKIYKLMEELDQCTDEECKMEIKLKIKELKKQLPSTIGTKLKYAGVAALGAGGLYGANYINDIAKARKLVSYAGGSSNNTDISTLRHLGKLLSRNELNTLKYKYRNSDERALAANKMIWKKFFSGVVDDE